MAAIQFPNNPSAGDLFVASNGIRYTYDGEKWKTLGTSTVGTEGQFVETPTELTIDKVVAANTNAGAVGSMAVGAGVTLTIPASSSFRTLSGKSGASSASGIPITGGTFTGPVYFSDDAIIKGNPTDGSGELTLNCENNSHGIKIKGPPHSAAANYTLTLPNDTGTSGQVLTTNGSGVSSWSTIDLASKLSLTGGTLTGGITGTTANFSGNVGIGTTSPGANLEVFASVNPQLRVNSTSHGYLDLSNYTNGAGVMTSAAHPLRLGTANTERMRIDSSGRLLVGSSSSADTNNFFEVHSTFGGRMGLCRNDTSTASGNNLGLISFYSNDGTYQSAASIAAEADGDHASNDKPGRLEFRTTADGASSPTERMRIDSSGNVGQGGVAVPTHTGYNSATMHLRQAGSSNSGSQLRMTNGATGHTASDGLYLAYWSDTNCYFYNQESGSIVFGTTSTERMRIDSSGRLLVGTTTEGYAGAETFTVANSGNAGITIRSGTSNNGTIAFSDATSGTGEYDGYIQYRQGTQELVLATVGADRMRIDSDGNVLISKTSSSNTTPGIQLMDNGAGWFTVDSDYCGIFNRETNDGVIIYLQGNGANEGTISVSGTTVSYNGAHLSRWTQLPGNKKRTEIPRGTVLSNIDEMCEWGDEDNEQLNRMKVSNVEGDPNVSGVFQSWDDDDDTYVNDFYCAMTGDFVIRIAQGTTVARGDLLMSAGDGTAKPQDDDIVRSKTIAKVTSTTVSTTYSDNSYCVPCVLMAC